MSDDPENLMLSLLRALRTDLSTVKTGTAAIRRQLTTLGLGIARCARTLPATT